MTKIRENYENNLCLLLFYPFTNSYLTMLEIEF